VVREKEIWHAWRQYLTSRAELASTLLLSLDAPYLPMAYAHARFRSAPDSKAVYDAIPASYFRALPRERRWFWRASVLMPKRIFRKCFALVYGQTRATGVVSWVLSSLRSDFRRRKQLHMLTAPTSQPVPNSTRYPG